MRLQQRKFRLGPEGTPENTQAPSLTIIFLDVFGDGAVGLPGLREQQVGLLRDEALDVGLQARHLAPAGNDKALRALRALGTAPGPPGDPLESP